MSPDGEHMCCVLACEMDIWGEGASHHCRAWLAHKPGECSSIIHFGDGIDPFLFMKPYLGTQVMDSLGPRFAFLGRISTRSTQTHLGCQCPASWGRGEVGVVLAAVGGVPPTQDFGGILCVPGISFVCPSALSGRFRRTAWFP